MTSGIKWWERWRYKRRNRITKTKSKTWGKIRNKNLKKPNKKLTGKTNQKNIRDGRFNIQKSINIIHYISKLKEKKSHDQIIRWYKNLWQNTILPYVKSIREIRNSRPIPQHNKSIIHLANSQHQNKWRETWSNPTKIRDKTRLPTLSLSIQ
jgi:hypothetical protein